MVEEWQVWLWNPRLKVSCAMALQGLGASWWVGQVSNRRKHSSLEEADLSWLSVLGESLVCRVWRWHWVTDRRMLPAHLARSYLLPSRCPAFSFLSPPAVAFYPGRWFWGMSHKMCEVIGDAPQMAFTSLDGVLSLTAKTLMVHLWIAFALCYPSLVLGHKDEPHTIPVFRELPALRG